MIANIRVLREGNFEFLCELDIVKFQLQHYIPVTKIATRYYRFCSKDEAQTFFEVTKELDYQSVVNYICETGSWVIAFQGFVDQGEILNTPQGFYRKVNL